MVLRTAVTPVVLMRLGGSNSLVFMGLGGRPARRRVVSSVLVVSDESSMEVVIAAGAARPRDDDKASEDDALEEAMNEATADNL